MAVRRPPARRLRLLIALVLLLLLAGWAGSFAGEALVIRVPMAAPQAIISLGSHEWERLPAAAELARTSGTALVFLTQPRIPSVHNCHDCGHRAHRLVAAGVQPRRIVLLPLRVSNTRDEAAAARAECERRGLTRLLIVTSPYHTRRAWRVFERGFAGSHIALGIVPSAYSPARPGEWWKAPYDRAYVRYEYAAIAYDVLARLWAPD